MDLKLQNKLISNIDYFKKIEEFKNKIKKKLEKYLKDKIKEEYSLEETIPKLEEKIINIKNFDFLKKNFKDIIENKRHILLYCDYDNDGLSAGTIMSDFLDIFNVPYEIVFPSRNEDGYGLKVINLNENKKVKNFLNNYSNYKEPVYICSLDNGINNDDVNNILKNNGITYCAIDHHQPEKEYDNSYCMNPHLNGENIIAEENISTGLLVYGFCSVMFNYINNIDNENKKILKQKFLNKNIDLAILSTLSDYMKLDGVNRAIVKHFSGVILKNGREEIRNLININSDFMNLNKIYETLNMNIIPLLNVVGRLKNMELAYSFLKGNKDFLSIEDLIELNERKKDFVNNILEKIDNYIKNNNKGVGQKTLIFYDNEIEGGLTSIVSTRIAMSKKIVTLIGHFDGYKTIRFSIRSPFYNHNLKEEFKKIGYEYKGHNVAGVVEINLEDKDNFIDKVIKHFDSQNLDIEGEFILDTISDGDLINIDLIDLINSYGPYGAGLKEPSFEIKGTFQKQKNQLYIGTSISGKMQVMNIKVGDKYFRVNNKTGRMLTEKDIIEQKSIIVKLGYPYPNSNKVNLDLVDIKY